MLVKELQSLALDVKIIDTKGEEIALKELSSDETEEREFVRDLDKSYESVELDYGKEKSKGSVESNFSEEILEEFAEDGLFEDFDDFE
ncbi:MAG: hypothetical protein IJA22_02030 [Clostridia bacterium]|nr:hypothetical protein [Clostridia bacterium]